MTLEEQVRASGGLLVRLHDARKRAVAIARKQRPPQIRGKWDDDWLVIDVTLQDALSAIGKLEVRSRTCPLCERPVARRSDLPGHVRGCVQE